jgi:hypothetical protein
MIWNHPKLLKLCKIHGFEPNENGVMKMLEEASFDSVVQGICKNNNCDYSTDVEPDQTQGWCEECEAGTVVSPLIIAGLI